MTPTKELIYRGLINKAFWGKIDYLPFYYLYYYALFTN